MSRWTKHTTLDGDPAIEVQGRKFAYFDGLYSILKKLAHYEDLEEQGRLIDSDRAVDFGYLSDWYIYSVDENDEPAWTEKHIEELTNDFILIPKTEDVVGRIQGEWTDENKCSVCSFPALLDGGEEYVFSRFCPNCGAKMDEVENE